MSRPRKQRRVVKFFRITFHYADDTYAVVPLRPAPSAARKAFRLRKQTGGRDAYDVRLTAAGPRCDCRGFLRWRRCKHVGMLRAARMLD
jgi:hypothetical protein